VIVERNGKAPLVDPSATIAASATVVGNVRIGARAYVDHGAVIENSGPPIEIGDEAMVFAGAIVRSVGGTSRPAFSGGRRKAHADFAIVRPDWLPSRSELLPRHGCNRPAGSAAR
jgi:phosphosulfolactate phosphohydrolase-like enzyme